LSTFSTTELFPTTSSYRALHRNPATSPSYYIKLDNHSWSIDLFTDRLLSIRNAFVEYVSIAIEGCTQQVIAKIGIIDDFSFYQYYSTISLTFSDYPDYYAWPMPTTNTMIHIGSSCSNINSDIQLPTDLYQFITGRNANGTIPNKGTIIVAFGTMIAWNAAPSEFITAIVDALNYFDEYRIVWSYRGPKQTLKNHIKLVDWLPQTDLLNHENTVLFVSHAGLKRYFVNGKVNICQKINQYLFQFTRISLFKNTNA
jgi:hypothetical protein